MTHGSATIEQSGNTLTINQGTDRLIMGWQTFSIGQGETTRFVQPSSSSMALNRVYGGTRSMIEGRLEANGGVILINPAGITITKSGVVNVNTFIGSTHDITDDEFLKGGALNFKGTSDASVENLGTIHAETGDIALIARTVRNEGRLSAPKGVVGLAAGDEVLYQPNADERLLVKSQTASASSIHHSGSIQAAAAEIKAAGNPYAVAINLDGIIEARGNAARNIKPRVIVHTAQGDIKAGSTAAISASDENSGGFVKIQAATGNLQLDGKVAVGSSPSKGGEIQILGNNITLSGTALLDASGATGGGKIFIGGDYMGGGNPTKNYASEPLQNASTLRINKGAVMNADATVQGDGGVVINWADGNTVSSGSVSVRGGPLGGNGGFVEISGKQNLGFDGAVDVGAVKGTPGTVLFDPAQIQITSATNLSVYSEPAINYGGTKQISYTDYSSPYVWVMSQSFFTNFTSGTIILQAYNISLEDPKGNKRANIVLNPDVNLELHSKAGGTDPKIFLPSMTETSGSSSWGDTTRSSITASGTGYVKLDASQGSQLVIHGDITTAAGDIILIAQNRIDLAGATLKSTNGGAVNITSSAGDIVLNGSQITGTSGAIEIKATNGSIAATYSTISNSTGPISMIDQTGFNLTGSSIQSAAGDIAISSPAGAITMYSHAPGGVETNRLGSAIRSGSGSITLLSQKEIYLGGSTITTSGTNGGSVSLTSTGSFIKLYSDAVGGTTNLIPAAIQTVGGNIALKGYQNNNDIYDYRYAVTLQGALITSVSGSIDISAASGAIVIDYGSLSSGTLISSSVGKLRFNAIDFIYLSGANIASGSGSTSLKAANTYLIDSMIEANLGSVDIKSSYFTYFIGASSQIKSSAPSDAIIVSSGNYFWNYAGTNALQAPNGRWVVYSQNPANNYFGSLNSGQDAIWNTPAGTTLAADKDGNRYVFETSPYGQLTLLNASKVYGQNWTPVQGRDYTIATPNSLGAFTMASSDLDFSGVTVSLSSLGYDAKATVGSYPVYFISSTGGNITLAPGSSASLTVTPAQLTVGLTNVTKVYDGTTAVVLGSNNLSLLGLVNGDSVGLLNTPTSAVYATNGAGSGILITANAPTNLALSGTLASNYFLNRTSTISGYGTITPKMLTALYNGDASSVTKVYDGNNTATVAPNLLSLSGIILKDDVSINSAFSSTYSDANTGNTKTVTVSGLSLVGEMAGNYTLATTLTGSGAITAKTLTASLTGSVSKVYDATTAATLTPANYLLSGIIGTDKVNLNNPAGGTFDNANSGSAKTISVSGLALDNANYQLLSTSINGAIGTITPATSTAQEIFTEPTVQTAIQSLTIRNNTTTTSSGGSFGSSGPGSEGSGSGGESASAGETASSGESSSSESGGETASSESSGESGSSSESSTASTDSGSSATTASSDSASSSGSSSTASSSSSSSSSGSASSSSGGSSQGAKAQVAAMSRMNNPVGGATVGGAEFQRLNPFSDAGAMHEEVAVSLASAVGGTTQASTGRAAAVSVKSPEMTELAPMNDLNVLFMMF